MERDGVKEEAEKEKVGGGQEKERRLLAPDTQEMVDGGREKGGAGEKGNGVEEANGVENGDGGKEEEKERPVAPGAREQPTSLLPLPAATITTTTNTTK